MAQSDLRVDQLKTEREVVRWLSDAKGLIRTDMLNKNRIKQDTHTNKFYTRDCTQRKQKKKKEWMWILYVLFFCFFLWVFLRWAPVLHICRSMDNAKTMRWILFIVE